MAQQQLPKWARDSRLFPRALAERPSMVRLASDGTPSVSPVDYDGPQHARVLDAISKGIRMDHACAFAGVAPTTFQRWYKKGRTITELLGDESAVVDGVAMGIPYPTGMMHAYYQLYLDVRQAQAMAIMDATNAVRRFVTGYTIAGEWAEFEEDLLYAPAVYKDARGVTVDADAPGAVLASGSEEYDPEDPYKVRRTVKGRTWIPAKRIDGNAGVAWSMLQRLDPDEPVGGAAAPAAVVVNVDARTVAVYGHDLSSLQPEALRALAGNTEDLGDLLEG